MVAVFIEFRVVNASAGTHYLHIAIANSGHGAHAVFVFQISFEWDADNFHVVMRVRTKAASCFHGVIIEYPEYAEVHSFRVVVIGETETVMGIEPAMVGVATGFCFVQNVICHDF